MMRMEVKKGLTAVRSEDYYNRTPRSAWPWISAFSFREDGAIPIFGRKGDLKGVPARVWRQQWECGIDGFIGIGEAWLRSSPERICS
jgi:hypothetical protein